MIAKIFTDLILPIGIFPVYLQAKNVMLNPVSTAIG